MSIGSSAAPGSKSYRPGIYMTAYGNTVRWDGVSGYDMDMGEYIPTESIDFTQFVRESD